MRNDALLRVLQVLRLLQSGPQTLEVLALECSVTTRTIRRDLDVLSLSGFAVTNDRFDDKPHVWRLISRRCPVCEK